MHMVLVCHPIGIIELKKRSRYVAEFSRSSQKVLTT